MITKLVLFLCLFCPVPDKERAILEDALSRCSSLERIGEIMDIVERHHLEYRIPVHPPVHRFHRISSAYGWRSDPVTGQRRFHQEWILRRNLHRPCMPQLMERSYTQEEREDMDTV